MKARQQRFVTASLGMPLRQLQSQLTVVLRRGLKSSSAGPLRLICKGLLTETARLAVSANSEHREVRRIGRTAKKIATEIGEELIKVWVV